MNDSRRLDGVVADTSALVGLAVPRAVETYDTAAGFDPLAGLVTSCAVSVPERVVAELDDVADHDDVHAAAAATALAARDRYDVVDPYDLDAAPAERPAFGLDEGETDGAVLANAVGADGFLTDEFAGTSFALVHAALAGPRLVTTPRLLRDYARNGHVDPGTIRALFDLLGEHRDWAGNPYVERLRASVQGQD